MDTLLTEIIGFLGTAKGFRLTRQDRSCKPYFNMIIGTAAVPRVLEQLTG
jgi:hypothetical protein